MSRTLRALAGAMVAVLLTASGVSAQTSRTLVMPFDNVTQDGKIFWLGEAAAVLVADDLNALGISAIAREERRAAFERFQVPIASTLTDATVIRIGQLVGAAEIIVGTLRMDGETLIVTARSVVLETAHVQTTVTERGAVTDLFAIFERVARHFAPVSSRSSEEIERGQPPVAVFEDYIKGLLAGTPTTAINYLNTALKIQPSFDRARLALWEVYNDQDAHDRALAAVQPVQSGSIWYRRARFLVGLSQLSLKKYDDAFATFKALGDVRATAPILNNMGVAQIRRGGNTQVGSPAYFFTRATDLDGLDPDYFFNLGYASWTDRDMPTAMYWLREAVRRDPTDGEAHFVLGTALAATGNAAEANREKELARRLSSTFEEWAKRPVTDPVPKGLERVKRDVELPHVIRAEEPSGQRDQRELAQFYLDRGRRMFAQERDSEALAELNRALFLSPYLPDAHLLIGRIHLRGGRTREAVDALKISIWSAETAEAHAVLAEAYLELKDEASARAEAERALARDPASPARQTIEKLDASKPKPLVR